MDGEQPDSTTPVDDDPFAALTKAAKGDSRPSIGERFAFNAKSSYYGGTISGAGRLWMLKRAAEADSHPGAAYDYEQAISDLTKYEAMPSFDGPLEGLVSLGGQFGGALGSPESWLARVPGVGNAVENLIGRYAPHLAETAAQRTAEAAISQGLVNTATDPIVQGENLASGQQDKFDLARLALSFPVGAALGGTMHGATEIPGAVSRRMGKGAEELLGPIEGRTKFDLATQFPTEQADRFIASENVNRVLEGERARLAAEDPSFASEGMPLSEPMPTQFYGNAVPTARMEPQVELPPPSVTARMSAPMIRDELGTEIPGTLIRQLRGMPEDGGVSGIPAFHGSPHDFDRFSLDKIGTGEGNQTYGHGLYFAQSEKVARDYQRNVTYKNLENKARELYGEGDHPADAVDALMSDTSLSPREKELLQALKEDDWLGFEYPHQAIREVLKPKAAENYDLSPRTLAAVADANRLYEVRIAARPENFLDWDKPLSQQSPAVRAALEKALGIKHENDLWNIVAENGSLLPDMDMARNPLGPMLKGHSSANDAAAGETWAALSKAGVDGIRYLDGGSRGKGTGTSNFVVFDDSKIHIVAKNGQQLQKAVPLVDHLRGEAKAAFADELKANGVEPKDIPPAIQSRADDLVKTGAVRDYPTAFEVAIVERAAADPKISAAAKEAFGNDVLTRAASEVREPAGRAGEAGAVREGAGGTAGPVENRQSAGGDTGQIRGSTGLGRPPTNPSSVAVSAVTHDRPILSPQKQVERLTKELDATLRQGRLKNREFAGEYDTTNDVARVRNVANVGVAAHEAAHGIEKRLGAEMTNLINAHASELSPLDYDPTKNRAFEGFAEFIRLRVTDPDQATAAAPQFEKAFVDFIAGKDAKLLKALENAKQAALDYQSAPPVEKLAANVMVEQPDTLIKRIKDDGLPKTVSLMVGRAYEGVLDDKAPVTRAVRSLARLLRDASGDLPHLQGADNPEALVRLFARAHQAGVRDMLDGVRPYRSVEPQGPSLREALITATGDPGVFGRWDDTLVKRFNDYLVARESIERYGRRVAGDGKSNPISLSLEEATQAVAELERQFPGFRAGGEKIDAFNKQLLRKQFESGILDGGRETFDELNARPFYVPLYRDMSDKPLLSGGPTSGGNTKTDGPGAANLIKGERGSDRDIIAPIQSMMTMTFLINRTVAHNEIMNSLVRLAKRATDAGAIGVGRIVEPIKAHDLVGKKFDLMEGVMNAAREHGVDPADARLLASSMTDVFGDDPIMATIFRREQTGKRGEPLVFYREAGELRAARFISKEEGIGLYESLTALPYQMQDIAMKLASTSSTALRIGITTNPVFALTNFIRDQMAAAILRPDYVPFNPRGLVREVKQDHIAQLYNYFGGVSPGAGSAGLSELMDGHINELARKGWGVQKVGKLSDVMTKGDILGGAKAISEVVEVSEAGTRLNVMKQVFEQKKAQGLSDYDAAIEAAYQATDLMDFGRHGSGTDQIRALVPFLNAHLQGLDKFRRTALAPIFRQMTGDIVTQAEKAEVKNAALSLFKMLGIGGALGYSYSLLMKDHDAYRDANEDLRATHLIIPGGAFGNPGKIYVVPKPFELALGFNLGELMGLGIATGDPRMAEFATAGAYEVFAPPNVLESVPILKTWAELKLNRSLFTKRDIVTEDLQRLTPAEQYRPTTSTFAKAVGAQINVSPVKIDYAVGNLFGLWGRDMLALSNVTDPNAPAAADEDTMFKRRFIKRADAASETTKKFWDFAAQKNGKFSQATSTYENMLKGNRDQDATRFLNALPEEQKAYVTLTSAGGDDGKPKFTADDKRIHPLLRASSAILAINGYIRELTQNSQRSLETGERADMDPTTRRMVIDNLRVLAAMEQRNALIMLKEPGYGDRKLLSTDDQFNVIMAHNPVAGEEIATRYATAKIPTQDAVADAWPEMKRRLLADGGEADLADVTEYAKINGFQFGFDRVKKAPKRRVNIPPALMPAGQ